MAKEKKFTYCLLLMAVMLFAAAVGLSVGPTRADYNNAVYWNTLIQPKHTVTSNCLTAEGQIVLLGEIVEETHIAIEVQTESAIAEATVELELEDGAGEYLYVWIPETVADLSQGAATIDLYVVPREPARELEDSLEFDFEIRLEAGVERLQGTFRVELPGSAKEEEPSGGNDEPDPGENPGEGGEGGSGENPGEGGEGGSGENPGEGGEGGSGENPGEGGEGGSGENPGEGGEGDSGEDPGTGNENDPGSEPETGDESDGSDSAVVLSSSLVFSSHLEQEGSAGSGDDSGNDNGEDNDTDIGDDTAGDDTTGGEGTGDDTTGGTTGGDGTGDDTADGTTGGDGTGDDTTGGTTGGDGTGDDTTGGDTTGGDETGDDTTGDDTTGGGETGDDTTGGDTTGGEGTGDDTTGGDTTGGEGTGEGEDPENGESTGGEKPSHKDEKDEPEYLGALEVMTLPKYSRNSLLPVGVDVPDECSRVTVSLIDASFPALTRYTLDEGETWYMLFFGGTIEADMASLPDSGKGRCLLLDLSLCEWEDIDRITMEVLAYVDDDYYSGTCDTDADAAVFGTKSMRTPMMFTTGQPYVGVALEESWAEYDAKMKLERLELVGEESMETVFVDMELTQPEDSAKAAETADGSFRVQMDTTYVSITAGTTYPAAGTYRLTVTYSYGGMRFHKAEIVFFVNYASGT